MLGPLEDPMIIWGDGVIFQSTPNWQEQGPIQIRYGVWIPMFDLYGEKRNDLRAYLGKHFPKVLKTLEKGPTW